MKSQTSKQQFGFTFVEVMLAVLILGIGILAITKLQTSLLRGGAEANKRAAAAAIAEKKIDDLRRFRGISGGLAWQSTFVTPTSIYFDQIADNEGGLIPSGQFENTEFSIAWSISKYYYPTDLSAAVVSTTTADFKKVEVTVQWTDVGNNTQSVTLETDIFSYPPFFSKLADDVTSVREAGPSGLYTPKQAPDVVPIKISDDGISKETSKPQPEVNKDDYATLVDFESVTYQSSSAPGVFFALRREGFSTVACSCASATSPTSVEHIYGYTTWDPTDEQYEDYTDSVSTNNFDTEEKSGSDSIYECFLCCRDGQYVDTQTSVADQDQPFGFSDTNQSPAGTIDKVCRFKRIDGALRVIKPWRLIGFNVIPASYFNDNYTSNATANINSYSNYVTSLVRHALGQISQESDVYTVNTGFKTYVGSGVNVNLFADASYDHRSIPGSPTTQEKTIQARAIYLDLPPEGIFYGVSGANRIEKAANVPLDRIPFYEVNVTGLAGFVPDEDQVTFTTTYPYTTPAQAHDYSLQGNNVVQPCQAYDGSPGTGELHADRNCISNQDLTNKTYGDYERGEFYAYQPVTSDVISRIYNNSDGVVDTTVNFNTTVQTVDSSVQVNKQ